MLKYREGPCSWFIQSIEHPPSAPHDVCNNCHTMFRYGLGVVVCKSCQGYVHGSCVREGSVCLDCTQSEA